MKFYITTPLYYVNASPHIGHAYTNVTADIMSRFRRLKRDEVYFLTGTDEHGQKVEAASKKNGKQPQEFVDSIVPRFKSLWDELSVSYNDFIRTTEKRHMLCVEKVLNYLYQKQDLYKGIYEGWYCIPCETFWPSTQLEENICPDCKRALERIAEENYFFKISKYQSWLINYIKTHQDFILPQVRRNEILSFLENPLNDLCISRPKKRLSWGIPIPFSSEHITYVWFDALLNYISGVGYPEILEKFNKFWPADVHLIGKDILRPHTVYWPIMLHALGLPPPKQIFVHGWWLVASESGQNTEGKMSKSKGNIVEPDIIIKKYGKDALRYFLIREIPFGQDGVFSEQALLLRFNTELANDIGNLLQRTLTMINKYFSGRAPETDKTLGPDKTFRVFLEEFPEDYENAMNNFNFQKATDLILELANKANKFIEDSKPWQLKKTNKMDLLAYMVYNLLEILRIIIISLFCFIPDSAEKMWQQIGMEKNLFSSSLDEIRKWGVTPTGQKIKTPQPVFPRVNI